jgi:hypothetical protein
MPSTNFIYIKKGVGYWGTMQSIFERSSYLISKYMKMLSFIYPPPHIFLNIWRPVKMFHVLYTRFLWLHRKNKVEHFLLTAQSFPLYRNYNRKYLRKGNQDNVVDWLLNDENNPKRLLKYIVGPLGLYSRVKGIVSRETCINWDHWCLV